MTELYLLLGLIIIGTMISIEMKNLMSSVVALSSVGLMLCVVFFLMRATEVAITQLVVEVLIFVILVRATEIKKDMTETFGGLREIFSAVVIFIFMLVFGGIFIMNVEGMHRFGEPIVSASDSFFSAAIKGALMPNLVNAVIVNYRAYDMLFAVAVLFAAAIGSVAVLRTKGREGSDERDDGNN